MKAAHDTAEWMHLGRSALWMDFTVGAKCLLGHSLDRLSVEGAW